MAEDKEKIEKKDIKNPGSVESKSSSEVRKESTVEKGQGTEGKNLSKEKEEEIKEKVFPIEKKKELLEYYSKDELAEKFRSVKKELVESREQIEELQEGVQELQDEVKSWKNKYMHLQADFENAQKRWVKSRQELRNQNTANVIKDFLPLYDSFQKALENKNEKNQKEIELLEKFYNQFLNLCRAYKAEPMEVKTGDSFDYNLHEAVTTIEKEDLAPNTIVDVIQQGWKINKDVLRYAKVVLSRKPKPPEPKKEEKEEEKKEEEQKEQKESETPPNKENEREKEGKEEVKKEKHKKESEE